MNDFLVDVVYKNSQKSRYKNGIEEKRLKQQIHGNTGFEKKLITSLSKHEKQQKRLEEEYFYLQNEMHKLGIQRHSKRDHSGDTFRTLSSVNTFKSNQASRLSSSENYKDIKSFEKNEFKNQIYQDAQFKSQYFESSQANEFLPKEAITTLTEIEEEKKKNLFPSIKNNSRRRMTIADISSNNNNFITNLTKKNSNHTKHKSMDGLSESALNFHSKSDLRKSSIAQNMADSRSFIDSSINLAQTNKNEQFDWLGSASLSFNIPIKKNISTKLPTILKNQKNSSSFGQELNQLNDPTSYRHSKPGYDRYKSNPHIYLPDGNMKRKFSLPKLSESIEQFKECRYLRRGSLLEPTVSDNEISGIFSFTKPNSLNEDDDDSESDSDSSVN